MSKKRFTVAIIASALSLMVSATSWAAEKIINFKVDGQNIVGTLVLPDGVKEPPVVLMLHGFTGTRDEWKSPNVKEGLFGRTAPVLSQNGIASLRIDFRGSGDSEGKFEDMTVDSEIKDALAALDYLSMQGEVDKNRISVMGMSLGGIVTTAVAGRTNYPLKSVVLWNPGINPPAAFMTMFGTKTIQEAIAGGDKLYSASMGGPDITLKGTFYESLFKIVPAAELSHYSGPVLLAVGTKDTIVWPQPASAEALLSYHKGFHELWTRPVDHGYNLMENAETVDALIAKTANFLKSNFK